VRDTGRDECVTHANTHKLTHPHTHTHTHTHTQTFLKGTSDLIYEGYYVHSPEVTIWFLVSSFGAVVGTLFVWLFQDAIISWSLSPSLSLSLPPFSVSLSQSLSVSLSLSLPPSPPLSLSLFVSLSQSFSLSQSLSQSLCLSLSLSLSLCRRKSKSVSDISQSFADLAVGEGLTAPDADLAASKSKKAQ
jgi:hypothetical protein